MPKSTRSKAKVQFDIDPEEDKIQVKSKAKTTKKSAKIANDS